MASLPRYGPLARFYDVLSFERVYRPGRVAGIEALRLEPGARVLDVGCGTGLNFPRLRDAVGPGGHVVGVDASAVMLRQAERRITGNGWANVALRRGDAGDLAALLEPGEMFDAVLFTYSLSIIAQWQAAWQRATSCLRPGGRVAVVDLSLPSGGWRALARLACFTGGADPHREPWHAVLSDTGETMHMTLRAGHLHIAAGTVTGRPERGANSATRTVPL